jgi:hypothetical protein
MAITLRTVTGSALTYEQVDTNFSSLIHSASISGNQLTLHYPSSSFAPNSIVLPIESASYATSSSFATNSSTTSAITGSNNRVPRFSGSVNLVTSSIATNGPQVHINPQISLEPTAILQIDSRDRGVLFPSMTSAERLDIASPPNGLIVFDVTLTQLCMYIGEKWTTFTVVALPEE